MKRTKIKTDYLLLMGLFLLFNAVLTFWSKYYHMLGRYLYFLAIPLIFFVIVVKKYNFLRNKLFLSYLLFVFYVIFCAVIFFNRTDNLSRLFTVCFFQIPLILGIDCYCKSEERLRQVMQTYVVSCVIMSIAVLLAGSYGASSFRFGWSVTGNQVNTPALNLGLAISITFYHFCVKKENRSVNLLLTIFFLIIIFLTGSRKMLIFVAFVFASSVLFSIKDFKKALKSLLPILLVAVLGFVLLYKVPILYNTIGYRLFHVNSDSSATERDELRKGAIEYFSHSPIIGNGFDTYRENNDFGLYAHDNYAELLSGVGIIGLMIYYLFKFKYTYILFKNRKFGYNLLFASVMIGLFIIEMYSVNYLQWAIFSAYTMSYSQYKLFIQRRNANDF